MGQEVLILIISYKFFNSFNENEPPDKEILMRSLPIAGGLVFVILACDGNPPMESSSECAENSTEPPPISAKLTQGYCPADRVARQRLIVATLFKDLFKDLDLEPGEVDTTYVDSLTCYDYNDYENCPKNKNCSLSNDATPGYRGGHSGWDVQTRSVAGDHKTEKETFYSLTSGKVLAIGGQHGKIAVYDRDAGRTVVYLHARDIYVKKDDMVEVGDSLGIQGNVGLGFSDPKKSEHVHIEVRDGESEGPSGGAGATIEPKNRDPIDYLYQSIVDYESIVEMCCAPSQPRQEERYPCQAWW